VKEIIIDGVEYTLTPKVAVYKYPLFMRNIENNGLVIKFTGICEGIVVSVGTTKYSIGYKSENWTEHTDTRVWKQVEDPNKLNDKDLVLAWDNNYKTIKMLAFYDKLHKRIFSVDGGRNGYTYHNYEKIQPKDWPEWAKEAHKLLGD